MRVLRLPIVALLLGLPASIALAGTVPFGTYVPTWNSATFPLGSSDYLAVAQGGHSLKIPGSSFLTLTDAQTLHHKTIDCNLNTCLNFLTSGAGNFIQPSGTYGWGGNIADALYSGVMGSSSSPNTSADAALVIQRIGIGVGVFPSATAALFSGTDNGDTTPGHLTGMEGLIQSSGAYAPGSGTFFEGLRGQCDLLSGSTYAQCEGAAAEANIPVGATGMNAFGSEADINNNSGTPASPTFSQTAFSASFLASCGDHGTITNGERCENAYVVNPNNAYPFIRGLFIPLTATTLDPTIGAAIQVASYNGIPTNTVPQGLKMDGAVFTSAALTLPNGGFGSQGAGAGIKGANAAGSNLLSMLYMSSGNLVEVGADPNTSGVMVGWPGLPVSMAGVFGVTPASWVDTQTCTAGQITADASYIYVCTATNTVKRVALSSF